MAETEEKRVATVVRTQIKAMLDHDIDTLKAIIAPNAKLFHITGMEQSRDEWLQQIKLGRMRYFSNKEVLLQANIDSDNATVISRNELGARIHGFSNTWPLESRTSLKKINDRWLITESHSSMY